jgi:hypothetical protein
MNDGAIWEYGILLGSRARYMKGLIKIYGSTVGSTETAIVAERETRRA